MRHIVVCGPAPVYIIFPHHLTNGRIFAKKGTEHKMRVLIFSKTSVKDISRSKKK